MTTKIKKVLWDFLKPQGANYNPKAYFYNSLKGIDTMELEHRLMSHLPIHKCLQLLTLYVYEELNGEEENFGKIRITQEQFENYFRIIKPREKE